MAWRNENLANLPVWAGAAVLAGAPHGTADVWVPGDNGKADLSIRDRRMAAVAHLGFVVGFLTLPALLSVGCRSTHVRRHAAAAANFHAAFAAVWVALLVGFVGLIVVSDTFNQTVPALLLIPIMAVVFLAGFGLSIAGAVQALRGNSFRYPVRLPIFGRHPAPAR